MGQTILWFLLSSITLSGSGYHLKYYGEHSPERHCVEQRAGCAPSKPTAVKYTILLQSTTSQSSLKSQGKINLFKQTFIH